MRKFFIVLSGIYLTGLGMLSAIFLTLGFFVTQSIAEQTQGVNAVFSSVVNLVLSAVLVAAGIGIILRKNWARYSLFILSGLAIFIGLILCIVTMVMPLPAATPEATQAAPYIKMSLLIFTSIFFFAIPIFFFVFFSRGSIRELFISKERSIANPSKRPFGITLIAALMLFGALSSAIQAFFPSYEKLPVVDSIFISGNFMRLYCLFFSIISLYIAIELFRLMKGAWITYVVFSLYGILISVINIFTFSNAVLVEMMPRMAEGFYIMPDALLKFFIATGTLVGIAMLAYVYSRKHLFF